VLEPLAELGVEVRGALDDVRDQRVVRVGPL
jgi:hypothetical protein